MGLHGLNWTFRRFNDTWVLQCKRARVVFSVTDIEVRGDAIVFSGGNIFIRDFTLVEELINRV